MFKTKCFNSYEFTNYAIKCPHKKTRKKTSRGVEGEVLASNFEIDFTLISCMVSTVMGSVWDFDSGALFHMTSKR